MVTQLATQATGKSQDLRIKIFQAALAVTSWAATGDALFAAGGGSSGGRSMSLPLDCGHWSALPCWYMPCKDAVAPDRRAPLEGPLHNKMALLLALVRHNYIRKNFITSRDGRI
jgi:hypothetical protein